jgi:hypothetical protein
MAAYTMGAPYEAHLALITDLLSPGELHPSVFLSLAHHVAILDEQALFHLVKTCLQSPSLWSTGSVASASTSHSPDVPVSFDRSRDIYNAFHQGILQRFLRISKESGTGWQGRRKTAQAVDAILSISEDGQNSHLPSLTIISAVIRAVQETADSETSLVDKAGSLRKRSEHNMVQRWKGAANRLPRCDQDTPEGLCSLFHSNIY